jgi:serine/threonine protein phosphatase PrpC
VSERTLGARLEFASLTDVGRVRPHNEDYLGDPESMAAFIGERGRLPRLGWLFAVADGMGGHAGGEVASRVATEALFSSYYASGKSPRQALEEAVAAANAAVCRAADASAETGQPLTRMGTTLVAALVAEADLYVANVGDSRAYLLTGGVLRQITQDHSFVAEEVRLGIIRADEARRAPLRNVVTRALGARESSAPDLFQAPWGAGSVLLICTDGLHGVVEDHAIGTVLGKAAPERAVKRLIDAANAGGGPDNVSAIVVRAGGPPES